ncbi:MAG TPA: SRPBCC domain-containing protein, partial [Polyangiaceae bacterium]|nr:SRPBCC domain-containing protein [Polyangiaceae bacterium]
LETEPARRVRWQVNEGPAEWMGTQIGFELRPANGVTHVLFEHQGWPGASEFMHHCSTKWALFLMSLKSRVETGKGAPYPDDVHISGDAD